MTSAAVAAPNTSPASDETEGRVITGGSQEPVRPITIPVSEDVLRKLKIIAIVRNTSVGELLADAAAGIVKRDLRKALAKLGE